MLFLLGNRLAYGVYLVINFGYRLPNKTGTMAQENETKGTLTLSRFCQEPKNFLLTLNRRAIHTPFYLSVDNSLLVGTSKVQDIIRLKGEPNAIVTNEKDINIQVFVYHEKVLGINRIAELHFHNGTLIFYSYVFPIGYCCSGEGMDLIDTFCMKHSIPAGDSISDVMIVDPKGNCIMLDVHNNTFSYNYFSIRSPHFNALLETFANESKNAKEYV